MTDEFDERLRGADPAPREVDSSRSPRARALLEQIMTEPTTIPAPADRPTPAKPAVPKRWLVAAAAALAVVGIAGVALTGNDDDADGTLALSSESTGGAMAACIQLTPESLTPVDVAFVGTATAYDGTTATLDVTRWYKGGDAGTVTVEKSTPGDVALDGGGITFTVGEAYLVTATEGMLNDGCGMSGPVTPEFQALFDQAFPG